MVSRSLLVSSALLFLHKVKTLSFLLLAIVNEMLWMNVYGVPVVTLVPMESKIPEQKEEERSNQHRVLLKLLLNLYSRDKRQRTRTV